jgi:F0F1-type ATP synthase alpha subunit
MSKTKDFIVEQIKESIGAFQSSAKEKTVGRVIKVSDGIASVAGLNTIRMSEMVEFKTDEGTCSARYNLYGSMLSDD